MIGQLPHFLGIGAPRAGTTWVYEVLARHPDVFMPPVKEVHYFDVLDPTVERSSFRYGKHLKSRLGSTIAHFAPRLSSRLSSKRAEFAPTWDLRYFLGSATDEWYQRLFTAASARGKLCGEITPSYSLLSTPMIGRILSINPDMKFVYIIRDPIERAWSHAVKALVKDPGRKFESVIESEYAAFYQSTENLRISAYASNIDRYLEVVNPSQLLVLFFDDIQHRPQQLLSELCRFLGCSVPNDLAAGKEGKVNSSAHGRSVPVAHAQLLAEIFLPELEQLARRYPTWPQQWLERARIAAPS